MGNTDLCVKLLRPCIVASQKQVVEQHIPQAIIDLLEANILMREHRCMSIVVKKTNRPRHRKQPLSPMRRTSTCPAQLGSDRRAGIEQMTKTLDA